MDLNSDLCLNLDEQSPKLAADLLKVELELTVADGQWTEAVDVGEGNGRFGGPKANVGLKREKNLVILLIHSGKENE